MKENREEEKTNSTSSLANAFITESNLRNGRAVEAACQARENIEKVSKAYANTRTEQLAGRLPEEDHAGSFGINARRVKHYDLAANANGNNGRPHAAAVIVITKNGSVVSEVQVKYCGRTTKTTLELSDHKYDGMRKIHPND